MRNIELTIQLLQQNIYKEISEEIQFRNVKNKFIQGSKLCAQVSLRKINKK